MKRNFVTLGLFSLVIAACGGGENGIDGKDGKDGASCTIADNGDGSATITCPDGSTFTVKNGEDGQKGDAGSDGEKGQNGQSCKLVENADGSAAVICPYDGTSYIVRGNTDNYADYCAPGYWGKNCIDCSVNSKNYGTADCSYTDTRDSNSEVVYPLVRIGNQLWMAENLRNSSVDHYSANNDSENDDTYGYLYTWENAMKACPSGWRLPKADEFLDLIGGTEYGNEYNTTAIQSTSWNTSASNSTGFGALPAGEGHDVLFPGFGSRANFWSATPNDSLRAYGLNMSSDFARVSGSAVYDAFSVRCIKDYN